MVLAAMLAMALVAASQALANTSVIAGDVDGGFGNTGFVGGFGNGGFDDGFGRRPPRGPRSVGRSRRRESPGVLESPTHVCESPWRPRLLTIPEVGTQ